MGKGFFAPLAFGVLLAGCQTSQNLTSALGTMKNPHVALREPAGSVDLGLNPAIAHNYAILVCLPRRYDGADVNTTALSGATGNPNQIAEICGNAAVGDSERAEDLRLYLAAGFDLADEYCDTFIEDADESQRRRQYGRALWNDTGTAISTILGLANAGESIVTGVAAGFGLGDSAWRNYDEAFVVGPDLANVVALVDARQQLFRATIFAGEDSLPENFIEAQSEIRRYASHCSFLGMTALLNEAAQESKEDIVDATEELQKSD